MKMLAAAALVAVALPAHALELPDTPAGRALASWVNAVNSGDMAKMQAHVDAYHRKSAAKDYLALHDIFGDLSVLKIEKNEPNDIVVILGESITDDVLRAEYRTDPNDPMKLDPLVAGIDRPDDLAIPRIGQDEALKAAVARADKASAEDKFTGVVLVESHGKILLEKAWGYGDREAKIPLEVTDKFRLGSMNKMFTAVATLQLVGQGKLSLDGTVGQYLPGYPNKEVADKVTIRMLLTHVGGTGDIFGDEFDKHRLELKTLDDYVTLYGVRAPEFPPGSQTMYSNYGSSCSASSSGRRAARTTTTMSATTSSSLPA